MYVYIYIYIYIYTLQRYKFATPVFMPPPTAASPPNPEHNCWKLPCNLVRIDKLWIEINTSIILYYGFNNILNRIVYYVKL